MKIGFGASLLTLLFGFGAIQNTAVAEITVLRGNSVETIATGQAGPTVLRGGGTMQAMQLVKAQKTRSRIVAGRTLWIVDAEGRPRGACFLAHTGYVGKRAIRCTNYEH